MAETAVRGKPVGGRGFRVILAVLVGCFVLAAAVGVGAFDDDEGGTHEPGTDALRAGGILEDTECGPGRICPTEPMLRWVMAVWLVRAVDGADPTGSASGRFSDVSPNEWWATHVERLAELEVTLGCGDGTGFCPADAVTRAQMATFLVRAFGLDADGGSGFGDIAGNTHEASINILAAERVTAGCSTSPLRYCPNQSVTRGQMATFLARALNLIPLPDPPETTTTPPAGQRIAYTVTTGDGNQELWVINATGANQTKVTELPAGAGFDQMTWSPDGTHIAYTYRTDGDFESYRFLFHLWVTDADGTNPTKLAESPWSSGGWSPDGTRIAYTYRTGDDFESYRYQLWVADADGTNPTRITDSVTPTRVTFAGTSFGWGWSPDGTRLLYKVATGDGPQLWAADADGADPLKLADDSAWWRWSPDSTHILYTTTTDDYEDQSWVADPHGANPTKLTDNAEETWGAGWGYWSPDGTRLAYKVGTDDGIQLWAADADGANPTKVTDDIASSSAPAWSPDSTHILYTTTTDDYEDQSWVADADGADPLKLADESGRWEWSPDGTRLAYRVGGQLWVADADGADPLKLADESGRWEWSPDGTRLAYRVGGQLWVADADGADPLKLADESGWWEWSPDGTRLAYRVGGQLWVADADGADPLKLADNTDDESFGPGLGWSPDGASIAYTDRTGGYDYQLWVADADGTEPTKLADSSQFYSHRSAWSPDGARTDSRRLQWYSGEVELG